ncbi:hypothetical protein C806_01162 [Lachnospiraceae bacterium 3-1]|nr:hypothetical protein C806_01162 [Lachnospiraceae bacterium 3-1]
MATTKEFHDYIVENLRRVGDVTTRKMMGEYCIYFQEEQGLIDENFPLAEGDHRKPIGNICDNCLFLKPTESVLRLMPDADRAYPYEGSKTLMVVAEDVENVELMREVLHEMYQELPNPKKKTKK